MHAIEARDLTVLQCFQIRAFCRGETSLSYRPYECRIPFRDVVPGGVQLRARYNGNRVTVHLSIQSRRPPRYSRYLNKVLRPGILSIDKRHATEADYLDNAEDEKNAGKIYAVGDPRLLVSVRVDSYQNIASNDQFNSLGSGPCIV